MEIRYEIGEETEEYTEYRYSLVIEEEQEDGEITEIEVGQAAVYEGHTEDYYPVEIKDLEIDDDYRNRGLGSKLIKSIVQDLGPAHISPMNSENERLYARLGKKLKD